MIRKKVLGEYFIELVHQSVQRKRDRTSGETLGEGMVKQHIFFFEMSFIILKISYWDDVVAL